MISEVRTNQPGSTNYLRNSNQQSKTSQATQAQENSGVSSDVVEIGTSSLSSSVYTKPDHRKSAALDIEKIKQQAEKATENLRLLVEKLILHQGKTSGSATESESSTLETDTVEQAQLSISQDGEFGVEAVSDRIVDFAIAISGNDKTKLAELKASIDKGFAEAEKSFGGSLPSICNQTYDKIMEKLDKWSQDE